jgi:hypothetical protein
MGIALEKDAGERDVWDYAGFGLAAALPRQLGWIYLGDYLLDWGQGLLARTRRNYGLSGQIKNDLDLDPAGLKTYKGWDEAVALRGAALQGNVGDFGLAIWASRRHRDAYLDSSGNVTAFDLAGKHRSNLEELREDACREDIIGARIRCALFAHSLELAAAGYAGTWDRDIVIAGVNDNEIRVGTLEISCKSRWFQSCLEAAMDSRRETAAMLGLKAKRPGISAGGAVYRLSPEYFSPLASSLDFDLGAVRNRAGAYAGFEADFHGTTLSAAAHLHRRLTRMPGQSWGGQDIMLAAKQKLAEGIRLALSSRWTQEEETTDSPQTSHWRGAGTLQIRAKREWLLTPGLKLCRSNEAGDIGQLLSMTVKKNQVIAAPFALSVELFAAIYSASGYDSRLYWSDVRLDGGWQIKPLWGEGRFGAMGIRADRRRWGRVEVFGFWDQPEETPERQAQKGIWISAKIP